jgi:hypothetical protein
VSGFGGDDHFIAMRGKIGGEDLPEVFFGRARWRTVVVSEIEVGDATVEGTENHGASFGLVIDVAKVMPEAKGDFREMNARVAAASVRYHVLWFTSGLV